MSNADIDPDAPSPLMSEVLTIRCTPRERADWRALAEAESRPVSAWLRLLANDAAAAARFALDAMCDEVELPDSSLSSSDYLCRTCHGTGERVTDNGPDAVRVDICPACEGTGEELPDPDASELRAAYVP